MLEGRLGDFTLPDILRLLAFTSKSGRLWVSEDGGEQGRIDVLDGSVRDATSDATRMALARRLLGLDLLDAETIERAVADAPTLPGDLDLARRLVELDALPAEQLADLVREQALDAVFDLLRWQEGAFSFESVAPDDRGPSALDLAVTVDELLDEATRRLEAHEAVRERTGDGASVVSIRRPGRERTEVALGPEGWTLLGLIDGRRSVDDLVALCGQGDYRTRSTLATLLDEGVVAIGDTDTPPPGERLVAAQAAVAALEARLPGVAAPEHHQAAPRPPAEPPAPEPAARVEAEPPAPEPASEATEPAPVAADAPPSEPAEPEPAVAEADEAVVAEPDVAEAPTPAAAPREQGLTARASAAGRERLDTEEVDSPPVQRLGGPSVTPLRASVRSDRVRTDPEIDEDLVQRLIDGVESL